MGTEKTVAVGQPELIEKISDARALCDALAEKYGEICNAETNGKFQEYFKKIRELSGSIDRQLCILQQNPNVTSKMISAYSEELKDVSEERAGVFEERIGSLYKGLELANRLCSYDNSDLYILLYRQEGDVMNLLKKLPAIKKYYGEGASRYHFEENGQNQAFMKKKLIKRIFIITKPGNLGVVRLFSEYLDGVISLKYFDLKKLAEYALSPCALHQNIFCEADAMRLMGNRQETDEGQWCRLKMFGGVLDIERDLCIPHNIFKPCCIPKLSEETRNLTKAACEQNKIVPENTVILSPYAKYSSLLEMSFWGALAQELAAQGKTVYTYTSENAPAVQGTKVLKADIDVLACLCGSGAKVISVHGSTSDVVNAVTPGNLICLSVIKTDKDREYAKARKVLREVNYQPNGSVYLRIEHFETEYVLKLLRNTALSIEKHENI